MQVRRTPVLAIILASYTLIVLDISIIITALPKIHHAQGFSATALSWLSWRVGFFINAAIAIAMMLAAPRYLPETERRSGRMDVAGGLSSTLGMTALVYGIVLSADVGCTDAFTLAALAAGVLLLALFVVNERRARRSRSCRCLFSSRDRAGAYTARLLFLGATAPFWFFTTQFLQSVAGYSPVQAGLAFLPVTLVNFAAAMAVPRLTRRFGNATLLAGALVLVLGLPDVRGRLPQLIAKAHRRACPRTSARTPAEDGPLGERAPVTPRP